MHEENVSPDQVNLTVTDTYVRDGTLPSARELSRIYFDRANEIYAKLGSLSRGEELDEAVAEAMEYEKLGYAYYAKE